MGPAVLAKPLLPDTPSGVRKCRPQPPRHPRLETYPEAPLKELSTYCYTCESWAVGAEALLHLYFGELGCNHCFHNIKSCSAFRAKYPMVGLCKGSGEEHNACRWVAPTCKYVMYNTRKTLSMARCIDNKFEKQEVFREATAYLRALLPLRDLYPWRSALKTIAKAGIAVDLSNCPPRLKPLDPSEAGRAVGKGMLGVSGLLNLEKSIIRLEKRDKLKDGPARMQNTPGSTQNSSAHTHTTDTNTENTHSSTDHPSRVNSTPASTESSPVPVETLQKSLNKTKRKSRTSTQRNILASTENSSNIQNQQKLHKKAKSRNTDSTTENTLPSTQTSPTRTENPSVSIETPHELHKMDVVKKNSVCIQPQNYLSEMPKPSCKTSITSQSAQPDLERRKRKKTRVEDASAENHQEEREEAELQDTFTSVANTAVTPQGTLPPTAKKKKLEVPSITTGNTAITSQDILPPRAIKEEKELEVPSTTTGNTAVTYQDILPSRAKKKKKLEVPSTTTGNTAVTYQDTLPSRAKKKKKLEVLSTTTGNTAVTYQDILPSRAKKKKKLEVPSTTGNTAVTSQDILPSRAKKKKKLEVPSTTTGNTAAITYQDILPPRAKKKKFNVPSTTTENTSVTSRDIFPSRAKKKKLEVPSTTTGNTAVTSQDVLPSRAKKKKLEVPSTTTGNTAVTSQDILPPGTEEREKTEPKHTFGDTEINALPTQDPLPVTAENAINKKHKKKIKNSLEVVNKPVSAEDVLPDNAFSMCVENTASRKQKKRTAESVGGPEPPSATAVPPGDTLPPIANISPKTHRKRKGKNSPEAELQATSVQDKKRKAESVGGPKPPSATAVPPGDTLPPCANISPKTHRKRKGKNSLEAELEAISVQDVSLDNSQLGSEESATSKKHKRRKLKHCDKVKFEVVGVKDPFPVTSLPSSAENTTSKKHKRRELKSHDDDTESEAAQKQRKRKLKSSGDVEREPLGKCSAFHGTLNSSGHVEDSPSRGAEAENSPSKKCQSTSPSTPAATEDIHVNTQDSLHDKLRHPSDKSTLRKTKRKQKPSSAASQGNSCEARQPPLDVQSMYNVLPELLNIMSPKNSTEKGKKQKVKPSSALSQGNSCEARQPPLDVQRIYNILPELLNITSPKNSTEKDKERKVKFSSATASEISLRLT